MIKYTAEFKTEAIQLVLNSKSSLTKVAAELGINAWTLKGWVRDYRNKERPKEPRKPETIEEENQRLKRELAVLRQERDILKKAAAYFAKEQL